eukprot:gene14722-20764_t
MRQPAKDGRRALNETTLVSHELFDMAVKRCKEAAAKARDLTQQRHAFIQDLTDAVATTSAAIREMYLGVDQFSPLHFIELAEVEYASVEAISEGQNEEPGRFSFVDDEDSNPILAITVKKDVRIVSFTTEEGRVGEPLVFLELH